MALEVRVCDGGPFYRSIKLDYDEAHRKWRWAGSGCKGEFNMAELVAGVTKAQANVQPPKWVEHIDQSIRSIRHVREVVAYQISGENDPVRRTIYGGSGALHCRVRWGLAGKRVDFTTSPGKHESLYSCSIRYRKLRKVVRRLNSISEK